MTEFVPAGTATNSSQPIAVNGKPAKENEAAASGIIVAQGNISVTGAPVGE